MKTAILAITPGGKKIADRIADILEDCHLLPCEAGVASTVKDSWTKYDGFIFIMAAGIAVRTIAPLLRNKRMDPCVVVCDECGKHTISLISGHLGGGNALAENIAEIIGGRPVITTASDLLGLTAIDLWARENNLVAEDHMVFTRLSSLLVRNGRLRIFSDIELNNLPADLDRIFDRRDADLIVSARTGGPGESVPILHPRNLVAGIGCNRGTPAQQIEWALHATLDKYQLSLLSIGLLASIDLKADEQGLLEFAGHMKLPLRFYSRAELNQVSGLKRSSAVLQAIGAYGVAEPAAVLASDGGRLVVEKMKWKDVTIAIAENKRWAKENYT